MKFACHFSNCPECGSDDIEYTYRQIYIDTADDDIIDYREYHCKNCMNFWDEPEI